MSTSRPNPFAMSKGLNIREQKVVVCGEGAVGKSTLTIRYMTKDFMDEYDPTVEDSYCKQVVVDDEPCMLEILDTAGQEEYAPMREQWYRHGQGFLLIFSITSLPSFLSLPHLHASLLRTKERAYVPCVIVANKCDLEHLREVSVQEARAMARELGCTMVEASAKEDVNVGRAFEELIRLIRKDQKRIARGSTPLTEMQIDEKGVNAGTSSKTDDSHKGTCCIIA